MSAVNPQAAPGLDLFVAAWLERWRSFGGTVFLDLATGKVSTCFPMPGYGGRADIEGEGHARDWKDGYEHGRIRELDDLLRLVPGAKQALAEHIKRFPEAYGCDHLMA
jgi:hypothetical protein